MPNLKGTKTEANLMAAFAGESQARNKYTYYASKAKKDGYEQIAAIFTETAENEKEHAKIWFKLLHDGVPSTTQNLLDAAAGQECGKIYIMLGINELGWSKTKTFQDQYAKLIDRVREDHPEAKIVLQSIPPVSAKQEAKKTYVNNARIAVYNEVIKTLAEEKECYFLDVAACLTGEDGFLPKDWNFDGIHLNPAGCRVWLGYLRTHSLEDEAIAAALEAG